MPRLGPKPPSRFERSALQLWSLTLKMYATGFSSPSGCRWSSTAPSPYEDASAESIESNVGSNKARTGELVNIRFTSSNALCWASPHTHWFPLISKSQSGFVTSDRLGVSFLIWFTVPRNLWMSPTLVGTGTLRIAVTLPGSGLMPVSSTTYPKKGTCGWENLHFTLLRVRPSFRSLHRTLNKCSSCSSCVLPYMRTSWIKKTTPSMSPSISDIRRWKCSGANVIPNGSLLKQKHPKGVMKVVSGTDSGERRICQNPELASSLDNILAPASWPNVESTAGRGCRSLHTLSFNRVRSMQMRTWPFGFNTVTMPVHHSVGSLGLLTFDMTPCFSMRSSSTFTGFSNGIPTRQGVERAYGLASSRSLIEYSPCSLPRHWKSDGNCSTGFSFPVRTPWTHCTICSDSIAGRPSRGRCSPSTTYSSCSVLWSPRTSFAENCPFTGRTSLPGPLSVCLGGVRVGLPNFLYTWSQMTPTFAPVLMWNQ